MLVMYRALTRQDSQRDDLESISSGNLSGMDATKQVTLVRQTRAIMRTYAKESSNNSFVYEAHTVPQPLGPEDLYASLDYEMKTA